MKNNDTLIRRELEYAVIREALELLVSHVDDKQLDGGAAIEVARNALKVTNQPTI